MQRTTLFLILSLLLGIIILSCYHGSEFPKPDLCGDFTDYEKTAEGFLFIIDSSEASFLVVRDTETGTEYKLESAATTNHSVLLPIVQSESESESASGLVINKTYTLTVEIQSYVDSKLKQTCGSFTIDTTPECVGVAPIFSTPTVTPGTYGQQIVPRFLFSNYEISQIQVYYTLDGTDPSSTSTVYNDVDGIIITGEGDHTLKAIAYGTCNTASDIATYVYTIMELDPPVADPTGAMFTSSPCITITSEANTVIYYTITGAEPNLSSGILYSECIPLSSDTVLKAVAVFLTDGAPIYSPVMQEIYSFDLIAPTTPTVNPPAGVYGTDINITLESVDDKDIPKIYYTFGEVATDPSLDESGTPLAGTYLYSGDIVVSIDDAAYKNKILFLRVIAIDNAGNKSIIVEYQYQFIPPTGGVSVVNPPLASPNSGIYNSLVTVTLSTKFDFSVDGCDVRIYYTTDGTDPQPLSCVEPTCQLYSNQADCSGTNLLGTGPFQLPGSSKTLKAVACQESDGVCSSISSFNYTIDMTNPSDPIANLPSGCYPTEQVVTFSAEDNSSSFGIYYNAWDPATETEPADPTKASSVYGGPLTIIESQCLKVATIDIAGNSSASNSFCFDINNACVAPPFATPVGGKYASAITVVLTSSEETNAIYYTLDGSEPTIDSTRYIGTIDVNTDLCIKAITVDSDGVYSSVTEFCYEFDHVAPSDPVSSVPAGLYASQQLIVLTATDDLSLQGIYYTLDGNNPTVLSTLFAGNIAINSTTTLKAIAVDAAGNESGISEFLYTVDTTSPSNMNSSIPGGLFNQPQQIVLSALDDSGDPTIYYTTDGSLPQWDVDGNPVGTTILYVYGSEISITASTTVNAIATDSVGNPSTLLTVTYNIDQNKPTAPTPNVSAGTYQSVTISSVSAPDAEQALYGATTIYYTTDESEPTVNSSQFINGATSITITSGTKTIKFIAQDPAGNLSPISTYVYTIDSSSPNDPVASPLSGGYSSDQNVTLSASDDSGSSSIRYTTDGVTIPTATTGTLWVDGTPISVTNTVSDSALDDMVIKAIAYDEAGNVSSVVTFYYKIDPSNVNPPTSSLVSWVTKQNPLSITLNCSGCTNIYYTTDATDPTIASTQCTPGTCTFNVAPTMTLKAIAENGIGTLSTIASWTYTLDAISPTDPVFSVGNGEYRTQQTVTLSSSDINGYTIFYTMTSGTVALPPSDPADPTSGSTAYTGSLSIGTPTNNQLVKVKALAIDAAGNLSGVIMKTFTFDTAMPVVDPFSVSSGTFNANQSVVITAYDLESNLDKIYYTTNGLDPDINSSVFSSSVSITATAGTVATTTLKAIACDTVGNCSGVTSETYTIDRQIPSNPVAVPVGGSYNTDQNVTLTSGNGSHTIYYTTNGTAPGCGSGSTYSSAVAITGVANSVTTTTLKAIACDSAGNHSSITTNTYIIDKKIPFTPTASVLAGNYNATDIPLSVTLSATDDPSGSVTMYYTLDSTDPDLGSTPYTGAISISTTKTLKVKAYDAAGNASNLLSVQYNVDASPPTITNVTPGGGSYGSAQSVSITCNDDSGTCNIYYTLDGSTPDNIEDATNFKYTGIPINIPVGSTTLKCIAYDDYLNYSGVTTNTYTVTVDTTAPVISSKQVVSITGTSAQVVWTTDENATSEVYYRTTTGVTKANGTLSPSGGDSTADKTSHSVSLTALGSGPITYFYIVVTRDSGGYETISSEGSFTTLDITSPPTISSATCTSDTTVLLQFSQAMDQTTSETATNYTLSGPSGAMTASSAVRQTDTTQVLVTHSPAQICGSSTLYTIIVNTNVMDTNSNHIQASNQTAYFGGCGASNCNVVSVDPFGDGTDFSWIFGYNGHIYLGPNETNTGGMHMNPDGTYPENYSFSIPKDTNGTGGTMRNSGAGPFNQFGSYPYTNDAAAGPDQEEGVETFFSGTFGGTEYLILSPRRTDSAPGTYPDTAYIYVTSNTTNTLSMDYIDMQGTNIFYLNQYAASVLKIITAVSNQYLMVGTAHGNDGLLRPRIGYITSLALTSPTDPDHDPGDSLLNGDYIQDIGNRCWNTYGSGYTGTGNSSPKMISIDSMEVYNDYLFIANNGGIARTNSTLSTTAPQVTTACSGGNARYTSVTPASSRESRTNSDYSGLISIELKSAVQIKPYQRAIPAMAVYQSKLFMVRNTTAATTSNNCDDDGTPVNCSTPDGGAQLWKYDGTTWSVVAGSGSPQKTNMGDTNNKSLAFVVKNGSYLYIGFDNLSTGFQIWRTNVANPSFVSDFESVTINGFGDGSTMKRLHSFVTLYMAPSYWLYITAGQTGTPIRVYRMSNS